MEFRRNAQLLRAFLGNETYEAIDRAAQRSEVQERIAAARETVKEKGQAALDGDPEATTEFSQAISQIVLGHIFSGQPVTFQGQNPLGDQEGSHEA